MARARPVFHDHGSRGTSEGWREQHLCKQPFANVQGMKIARLLLRLIVGVLFFGHGTQKLFGWFGGGGLDATAQAFEHLGMRPGRRNAIAAGTAEAAGGAALALGLATP